METTGSVADNAKLLERAKLLWEEYKYRHDLMWRLTFEVTAGFAALSVFPYFLKPKLAERGDLAILIVGVPALALLLVLVAIPMMWGERKLFRQVRGKYWLMERELFGINNERTSSGIAGKFLHSNFVILYLILLGVLGILNLVYVFDLCECGPKEIKSMFDAYGVFDSYHNWTEFLAKSDTSAT